MSVFEDYLSLGYWLNDGQRLALYKYLLMAKRHTYITEAIKLLDEKFLLIFFANGEIAYSLHKGVVSYRSRKVGVSEFEGERRSIKISKFDRVSIDRLVKFFAQAEVDVLRNYPIPKNQELEERGYAINVYPFYDLNYYSNGAGKAIGFLKKIQSKDDELLKKLLAS